MSHDGEANGIDRRSFVKWAGAAGFAGLAGYPGGATAQSQGQSGTLGDWSVNWNQPQPMLQRLNADEWVPPEFDQNQIANQLDQTNSGGMRNDPATAYGHDVMNERVGITVNPIEVPSDRLAPRTTTILASRAQQPTLLQVPIDFYMDLVQPGFLEPTDDIWDEETLNAFPAAYRQDFTTGLDSTLEGEHIYGSHTIAEGFFLHHRSDYLEEMGFDRDFLKRPTWSDLREVCEEAQNQDYQGYAWVGKGPRSPPRWWMVKVKSMGGEIKQDDGTVVFNSSEGVAALEWMNQLIQEELVPNPVEFADADLADLFLQGRVAAYETGGDLMRSAEEEIGFESYNLGAPPMANEGPEPQHASVTQTDLICINRFSPPEKKRAAMLYLDANRSYELDTQEWEQEGNLPANPRALEEIESPYNETLRFVMERATDEVWPQQIRTLNTLSEELQQVYGGQKSPQEALDAAQAEVDSILSQ